MHTTGCPSASSSQAPSLPNGSMSPSCWAKVDKDGSCVATCTLARRQHLVELMDWWGVSSRGTRMMLTDGAA